MRHQNEATPVVSDESHVLETTESDTNMNSQILGLRVASIVLLTDEFSAVVALGDTTRGLLLDARCRSGRACLALLILGGL